MSLDDEVAAILDELVAIWSQLDFARLRELWDTTDPAVVYIADELPYPLVGMKEIEENWRRIGTRLEWAAVEVSRATIRSIADDVALALFLWSWQVVPVDDPQVRAGHAWTTVLLRRRSDRWRIFHLIESPVYIAPADDS